MPLMMVLVASLFASLFVGVSSHETILVSGATGRTGVLVYKQLKAAGYNVRGLVRNDTKAKQLLDCGNCTEAEGIFVGDVTKEDSMIAAFTDVDRVVIATGAVYDPATKSYFGGKTAPRDIDWKGTRSQATLLARLNPTRPRHVLQISAAMTTTPDNFLDKLGGGWDVFYKLVAEADVMSLNVPFTIVKPTGLTDTPGGKHKLVTGHDGEGFSLITDHSISRADVAAVLVAAITSPALSANLRFDLSSSPLRVPTAPKQVLIDAAFPWQNRSGTP